MKSIFSLYEQNFELTVDRTWQRPFIYLSPNPHPLTTKGERERDIQIDVIFANYEPPCPEQKNVCEGTNNTMYWASSVAVLRSLLAPVVIWSWPKISSSATLPPMQTSRRANNCFLLIDVSSSEGSCVTIPKADPRGMIVALWIGCAPSVLKATTACPLSWYAVSWKHM